MSPVSNTPVDAQRNFRHRMGTDIAVLDGWNCARLVEFGLTIVRPDELSARLEAPPAGGIFAVEISPDEAYEVEFIDNLISVDGHRKQVLDVLRNNRMFHYPPQWMILVDEPCYIFPMGGAVLLKESLIIKETIYTTSLEKTLERQLGISGLTASGLPQLLAEATLWDASVTPVPLCSRWSQVYSHALAESLTQDSVFRRAGIADRVGYVAPVTARGSQNLVTDVAGRRGIHVFSAAGSVVKAPRVLVSSLLYSFAVYGSAWRQFTAELRRIVGTTEPAAKEPPNDRVYVSRIGATARPMRNEIELVACLRERGFTIFDEHGKNFEQQAAVFASSRLIVGPHGSGLTNAGFAAPGATVVELRPLNRPPTELPMIDNFVLRVCAGSGHKYVPHVSSNSTSSDEWFANIEEIISMIDKFY